MMRQKIYQSPVIKVVKFQIESGFAGSNTPDATQPILTLNPHSSSAQYQNEDLGFSFNYTGSYINS